MPTQTGDNKLGKRDTVTLAAYRDRIDPERKGVLWARPGWGRSPAACSACGVSREKDDMRKFALKPAWSEDDMRYVCNACCAKAWEARDA